MFYVICYFLFAYFVVFIMAKLLMATRKLRSANRPAKFSLLLALLLLPWLPYGVVAVQIALFWQTLRPVAYQSADEWVVMDGDAPGQVLKHQVL